MNEHEVCEAALDAAAQKLAELKGRKHHSASDHINASDIVQAYQQALWQPIETAPKDGQLVMIWNKSYKIALQGRWEGEDTGWVGDDVILFPTHWRPLPAPPVSS